MYIENNKKSELAFSFIYSLVISNETEFKFWTMHFKQYQYTGRLYILGDQYNKQYIQS